MDYLVAKATEEGMELRDSLVLKVKVVFLEHLVKEDSMVHQGRKVIALFLVSPEKKVNQVDQEEKVKEETKVCFIYTITLLVFIHSVFVA